MVSEVRKKIKKVLIIFGTRPEAIKMAQVILRLQEAQDSFKVKMAVTGQHRQMLDQVLKLFQLRPDHDLNIMTADQDLFDITDPVSTLAPLRGMRLSPSLYPQRAGLADLFRRGVEIN
jgi:UDP-N-acetylglucosamine 2-epimerase